MPDFTREPRTCHSTCCVHVPISNGVSWEMQSSVKRVYGIPGQLCVQHVCCYSVLQQLKGLRSLLLTAISKVGHNCPTVKNWPVRDSCRFVLACKHLLQLIGLLPSFCISFLSDMFLQGFHVSQLCNGFGWLGINCLVYCSHLKHNEMHDGQVFSTDASLLAFQAPAVVHLEPSELSTGSTFSLSAGGAIPGSSVKVNNALGQSLVKALVGGQKVPLTVVQRLWRLKDGQGDATQAVQKT